MHGAQAPQVKAKAKERLLEMVDPALQTLTRAMRGHHMPSAVTAARDVLDRAGLQAEDPAPPPRTGPAIVVVLSDGTRVGIATLTDKADSAQLSQERTRALPSVTLTKVEQ